MGDDSMEEKSKEELLAEIERLQTENYTLQCSIRLYQSVLASIRDTAKKYAPEVSDILRNHNSSIY